MHTTIFIFFCSLSPVYFFAKIIRNRFGSCRRSFSLKNVLSSVRITLEKSQISQNSMVDAVGVIFKQLWRGENLYLQISAKDFIYKRIPITLTGAILDCRSPLFRNRIVCSNKKRYLVLLTIRNFFDDELSA